MADAKHLPGFEERLDEVRAVRMRWFAGGAGEPPLALVHGLGGAASNWIALAPELARRRRVIVPELPGHGGSAPLPAAPNLNAYADRLGLLLEREDALPAVLVGHSLGGRVALRRARRRPAAVRGLVLVSSAGISTGRSVATATLGALGALRPGRAIAPHRDRVARSALLKTLVFGWWGASDPAALSPQAVEGLLSAPPLHSDLASAGRALVGSDPRLDLDRVRCPCLVLWGARDRWVPLEDGYEYARRLRAPLRLVPDCAHLAIVERPDACLEAIEELVERVELASQSR